MSSPNQFNIASELTESLKNQPCPACGDQFKARISIKNLYYGGKDTMFRQVTLKCQCEVLVGQAHFKPDGSDIDVATQKAKQKLAEYMAQFTDDEEVEPVDQELEDITLEDLKPYLAEF